MYRNKKSQSGAILIVCLLLLIVLTVMGVVMMQTTRLQERMAGNTRDLSVALQGAEAALRYGETVLGNATTRPISTNAIPCSVCQKNTLPVAIYDSSQFNWSNALTYGGDHTVTAGTLGLPANPKYTIEELAFVRDSLDNGQEVPEGRDFYQVSSQSSGASGLANTVLQSSYVRRF